MLLLLHWFLPLLAVSLAESTLQKVCYGEILQLKCEGNKSLEIYGAYYKVLTPNSTICGHIDQEASPCNQPRLERLIRNDCHGKSECFLGYQDNSGTKKINCRPSMFLNVMFGCVNSTQAVMRNDAGDNNIQNAPLRSTVPTLLATKSVTVEETNKTKKASSAYMAFVYTLVKLRLVYFHLQENEKKFLLCTILSIALGIFLFILALALIVVCGKRRHRKKTEEKDEEDSVPAIQVSAPLTPASVPTSYETVLVTRQNGVPLSEMTISSDSTLTTRGKGKKTQTHEHEVISTIRRSHSIDEGTQTDLDEPDTEDIQPRSLSVEEAHELGYLVDAMKYFNKRLDDDFYNEPNEKVKSTDQSTNPELQTFYYSEPERKPLLEKQNSIDHNRYSPPAYPSDIPDRCDNSRNMSELSYPTTGSNISTTSLDLYTPEAIFNGDTLLRHSSVNRTLPRSPRTPKLGVRGDGFEFIQANSAT